MFIYFKERGNHIRGYVEFLKYVYSEEPRFVVFSVLATILNNTSAFTNIVFLKFLLYGITSLNISRLTIVVYIYGIYMISAPALTNHISTRKMPILQQSLVFGMKKNIFLNSEKS